MISGWLPAEFNELTPRMKKSEASLPGCPLRCCEKKPGNFPASVFCTLLTGTFCSSLPLMALTAPVSVIRFAVP